MARKAISNDRYRLVGTYERLRKALVEQPDDGRLDKALSYWVQPKDRRLPIAFLDRSLRDLLSRSLDELMATPGVGQKKIFGFFDLLRRAAKASTPDAPFGLPNTESGKAASKKADDGGFDASSVSESLWAAWCENVHRCGLGNEKLGRIAPSLQALPTVIWHTRLKEYANLSLGEIRSRKTHGEKRVNAVLEIFSTIHEAVSTAALPETLDLAICARFIPPLVQWLNDVVSETDLPSVDDIRQLVASPLIEQIRIDLGDQVARLAISRLRLDDESPSVKEQAEAMAVTRARVYQLLEDCGKVMAVRWPEGRWLLAPLTSRFGTASPDSIGLLHGISDLFFPVDRNVRPDSPRELSLSQF